MSCDEGAQHAMQFSFCVDLMRSLTFAGIEAQIDYDDIVARSVRRQSDTCAICLRGESSIWHVDREADPALRCVRLKPI